MTLPEPGKLGDLDFDQILKIDPLMTPLPP